MPAFLPLLAAAGLCIASVHDGDTLTLCTHERVRLANIDAPELEGSPRCEPRQRARLAHSRNPAWCDYQLGEQSAAALRAFVATGGVSIEEFGYDQYGRILARVYVDDRDAGEYLIRKGLARAWR